MERKNKEVRIIKIIPSVYDQPRKKLDPPSLKEALKVSRLGVKPEPELANKAAVYTESSTYTKRQ